MAVRVRHSKTSAVPDSGDTNLVQPSDWNADHPITSDGPGLVGRTAAGAGPVAEVSAADGRALLGLGTAATSALSTTNAEALGTAAPGVGTTVARADHVHPMPTAAQVGADPAGTGASQAAVAVNARIQAGTVTGQYARWNQTTGRYEAFDLLGTSNTWTQDQFITSLRLRVGSASIDSGRIEAVASDSLAAANGGVFIGGFLGTALAKVPAAIGNRSRVLGGAYSEQGVLFSNSADPFDIICSTGVRINGFTAWHGGNSAQVIAGTVTGQVARWDNTTGRYEPVTLNTLPDAIDDAAAAGLGVAVGGLYRTGSTLKARIA